MRRLVALSLLLVTLAGCASDDADTAPAPVRTVYDDHPAVSYTHLTLPTIYSV